MSGDLVGRIGGKTSGVGEGEGRGSGNGLESLRGEAGRDVGGK
jgi:hypothetical protein